MNRKMSRILAVILCTIMTFSLCVPRSVSADGGKTEQYAKKAAAAGIAKAAGKIPVVGEAISAAINEFLPGMLGISSDHDKVMAKLDELYDAVEGLSLQMDKNQQALFLQFYQEKVENFNTNANKLKNTIDDLYSLIVSLENEYGDDPSRLYEKEVMIANLIKSNDLTAYDSIKTVLINTTDYICGTQISSGKEDGIFQLVYKANCSDSVLGCEAAIKSSHYVNTISRYMEIAYKTLFTIYAAKLYVCENHDAIVAEMEAGNLAKCDLSDYTTYTGKIIKDSVFGSSSTSLLNHYNRLFDESRSDSAINVYNNMIEDVWFCYIDSTDYTKKPAKINYIELDPEMGFLAPSDIVYTNSVGYDINIPYIVDLMKNTKSLQPADRYSAVSNSCKLLDSVIMERATGALSVEQIDRLMQHIPNNPAFGTDQDDLSFICVLDELGFSFEEYNHYVDSLPKEGLGTSYRDPNLPRAQTDKKYKIMPTGTKLYSDNKNYVEKGWAADYANGYGLQENSSSAKTPTTASMFQICFNASRSEDHLGDCTVNNTMLLFFKKAEAPSTASTFAGLSPATIPIICVGAAIIIAFPIVVVVVRKKKKKAATAK